MTSGWPTDGSSTSNATRGRHRFSPGRDRFTARGTPGQPLDDHCRLVARAASALTTALDLPPALAQPVVDAARWHDHGKASPVWQRAAGGSPDAPPIAKTPTGRVFRAALLDGYRHEFGSLLAAERQLEPSTDEAGELRRDLTLHLIAAHHGHARPGFARRQHWGDAMSEAELAATARATEMRFERLQRHLGPWRLAWLEALVKAADAAVSTGIDAA